MSLALNKAILNRLRQETLSGDFATAQAQLLALLGTTPQGQPAIRYGAKGSSVDYPEITFREDGGVESLGGSDIAIIDQSIYRFELWETTRNATILPTMARCLERLLDRRHGAPLLVLEQGTCKYHELFTRMSGPFPDTDINAFFGVLAFRFIEARTT